MRMRGDRYEELIADLSAAIDGFVDPVRRDAALWSKTRRRWSAGQHADHLARALGITADGLEANRARLEQGTLPRRPIRDPLQVLFVIVAIGAGRFPRGGRASRNVQPASHPDRADVLARIEQGLARHRAIGAALDPAARDRLWVPNPFLKGWYYTYPEVVRMHAVHFRHHTRLVEELLPPEERV